ncbi:MAG: hypothetical protein Q4C49_11190 [Bacillota bacterium]|nr:hypothetical protein [Bacillota bacterium]
MKTKEFLIPKHEIISLNGEDIITASQPSIDDGGNTGGNTGGNGPKGN